MNFLKKFIIFNKIIKYNRSEFEEKKYKGNTGIVLLEFNSFHISHIIFAYISNYFVKKNKYKIEAFYSHLLLSYEIKRSLSQIIKTFFGKLLNLGFFGVYKSFGTSNFIFPKINKLITLNAKREYFKIIKKITSKDQILNIKIKNIQVGDLIYDSYLTRNKKQKPTIDIYDEDFKIFLHEFMLLFYFWYFYFKENKIKVVISSDSCYTMGIPCRLAIKNIICCLEVKENRLKRLSFKNYHHYSETVNYPKKFKSLKKNIKINALAIANKNISKRFKGINLDMPYAKKMAFKNIKIREKKRKNKKFTILILPHDFIDAPHVGGKFAFSDMYEWIKFLSETSLKKPQYNWLLKTHKKQGGKFTWYQKFTEKNIDKLIKNSNIKKINSNITHNEIINDGVDLVLTVFGTVGHEYAFKNIKVINSSKFNPHNAYDFNFHCSKNSEYKKIFLNPEKLNFKIKKNKVLEFYYMHFIYNSKDWFFLDYNQMLKKLRNYHYQWTSKFYEYWLKKPYNSNFKSEFFLRFEKFLNSKDSIFNKDHFSV